MKPPQCFLLCAVIDCTCSEQASEFNPVLADAKTNTKMTAHLIQLEAVMHLAILTQDNRQALRFVSRPLVAAAEKTN